MREGGPPGGTLLQALAASRRYANSVSSLGADIMRGYPGETARILAAGAGSLACQVGAFGVLFVYLHALESGSTIHGFAARDSMALFSIVGVLAVLLFLGFTLLEFYADTAILRLCEHFQEAGAREVLSIAGSLPHWFRPQAPGTISDTHLRQLLGNDLKHRSRMARLLLRSLIPAMRLLLSAVGILYISVEFSLLILLVVGLPVAGLYWVGRHVADTVTLRETGAGSAFREQLALLQAHWGTPEGAPRSDVEATLDAMPKDAAGTLYFKRLRAKTLGQLLLNTANTLGIMVLVLFLGFWLLREPQDNWSLWATYLVALRYFLTSLTRVGQAIVQSSRFVRQVRRLENFLAAGRLAAQRPDPRVEPCPEHVATAFRGREASPDDDDFDDD